MAHASVTIFQDGDDLWVPLPPDITRGMATIFKTPIDAGLVFELEPSRKHLRLLFVEGAKVETPAEEDPTEDLVTTLRLIGGKLAMKLPRPMCAQFRFAPEHTVTLHTIMQDEKVLIELARRNWLHAKHMKLY